MNVLVTGTDTGVGKTFFVTNILKHLLKRGMDTCGFKPIETGCIPICQDANEISKVCNKEIKPIYSFKIPVAPSVASKIEGIKVNVDKLKEEIANFCRNFEYTFIEGAGGIMVPITDSYTYLDLARDLSLKVIVVALNKLGVINHTLLTAKACQCERVDVLAVVLNDKEVKNNDESRQTNYKTLKELLEVPVLKFSSEEDFSSLTDEIIKLL